MEYCTNIGYGYGILYCNRIWIQDTVDWDKSHMNAKPNGSSKLKIGRGEGVNEKN